MQRIDRLRTLTKQEIQKVRFVFAPTHPVLAALDYRSNDLFRYTFGSEDQLRFYRTCSAFGLSG